MTQMKLKIRFMIFAVASFVAVNCTQTGSTEKESSVGGSGSLNGVYSEKFRPQFHFTPAKNWMNDPNGMVYHNGEYHLFYQYNPFGDRWGHMSWGHAVSKDLAYWEHLPIALEEENNVMIFSGSAVVDKDNTTGFGTPDNPPMVAIYTGHHTDRELQDQRLAYSIDEGRTWTKYENNPVLDINDPNFRDPKVLWHEGTNQWVMVVAKTREFIIQFYGSKNLKDWEFLSEFGKTGAMGGQWECPALFELPIEGSEETKWVLQVDLNPGGPNGGSGSQYFVGDFDGKTFTQDKTDLGQTKWVDFGMDYYATHSFENIRTEDNRIIWITWMSNWAYAENVPTSPWRSAMTIPTAIALKEHNGSYHLVRNPVEGLKKLRDQYFSFKDVLLDGTNGLESIDSNIVSGQLLEVIAEFDLESTDSEEFGFKVAVGDSEETIIGYNIESEFLYIDRTSSGIDDFSDLFSGIHSAKLSPEENKIKLHFFLDTSSIEVLGNDGLVSITDLIFPTEEGTGFSLFTSGGNTKLDKLEIWTLSSIWN